MLTHSIQNAHYFSFPKLILTISILESICHNCLSLSTDTLALIQVHIQDKAFPFQILFSFFSTLRSICHNPDKRVEKVLYLLEMKLRF